jgi:hypothetical protein
MKEPMDNSDELLELLGAAWDGRLDEASFARLEALLASDQGDACDVLVAFSRIQVELAWLAASSQAHEKALSMLAPYFAESTTTSASPNSPHAQGASATRASLGAKRVKLSKQRFLAIAAGVLVPLAAFAWYSLRSNPQVDEVARRMQLLRAPHKVARVASVDDAVWQDGARYAQGDLLPEGERLHLLRGTAQISMGCGADILLQSPCAVELASDSRIRLDHGKLTAQAAEWAKGFVVETEDLRITDLGTRFAVLAESPGVTEAHVLEGVVRAEPLGGQTGAKAASMLVTAGQAVRWNEGEGRIERTRVEGSRFAETLPQFRPLHPINIANTGRGLSIGSRDPRWRITTGHSSGGSFPVQAVVCRPHSVYLEGGPGSAGAAGVDSQWISVLGGTSRGVASYSAFTFETSFNLANVDPATVHLVGQILVDNRVQQIRLNGEPVDVQPWEGVLSQDFQKFHVVEIREGFTRGVNRLEIDIVNGAVVDSSRNPMALRVEWQAYGCVEGN